MVTPLHPQKMTLRLTMKVQPHFNLVSLLGAPTSALRIALYVCNRLVFILRVSEGVGEISQISRIYSSLLS